MASYTPNLNLYKPDDSDDYDDFREKFNENMDKIDGNGGNQNIAEEYDDTATYAVGDYVIYNGLLYKCDTAVATAETFDPTKWTHVVVTDEMGGGGGSGGHTIIDESDTSMPQRTGLQFTGNVSVTDDAVNDKTIVDVIPEIYSTTERKIGKWIDGSDLFQITVPTNDPVPTGATLITRIAHDVAYDTLIYIKGVVPSIHLIEYIESTGTQCINTGILADATTFFEIEYMITATTSYATLIGVDKGGATRLFLGVCSNGINRNYFYAGNSGGEFSNSYNALNIKTSARYTTNTLVLENINGTITRTVTSSGISALDIPLYLFALNRNGNRTDYSKLRIYSVKITKNGSLVINAVPAKDDNGIACLYDYVSESYIYNAGSGAFVAGPDIN